MMSVVAMVTVVTVVAMVTVVTVVAVMAMMMRGQVHRQRCAFGRHFFNEFQIVDAHSLGRFHLSRYNQSQGEEGAQQKVFHLMCPFTFCVLTRQTAPGFLYARSLCKMRAQWGRLKAL